MTGAAGGDRMAPADAILWRMEHDPVLRSTVTSVSRLDRAPDARRFRRRVQEVADRIPRFRQVVSEQPFGLGPPRWRPAPDFDLDYHLRWVRLPGRSFDDVLQFAAREAMAGFDRARPLWEFTVVEEVDGGAALVERFHHAVTDGLGGMQVALELVDHDRRGRHQGAGTDAPDGAGQDRWTARAGSAPTGGHRPATVALLGAGVAGATAVPQLVGGAVLAAVRDPLRSLAGLADALRWGARLLAPVSAPLSPVMRGRSTRLAFAAFDVDLRGLHAAARVAGGSLNDAFVASVAGGLRRYHQVKGRPVTSLRITLPMSTRRPGDPLTANRFTPVRFEVPLVPADPTALVPAVASLVRQWRQGPALGMSDALAVVLSALPAPALAGVFGSLLRNVDFVATNVPGLQAPSYLAGARVVRQYAFAPPSGAAVNVAMLSHVDQCCIGVNMDPAAVDRPALLVRSLREGFDEVLALAPPAADAPSDPARATRTTSTVEVEG